MNQKKSLLKYTTDSNFIYTASIRRLFEPYIKGASKWRNRSMGYFDAQGIVVHSPISFDTLQIDGIKADEGGIYLHGEHEVVIRNCTFKKFTIQPSKQDTAGTEFWFNLDKHYKVGSFSYMRLTNSNFAYLDPGKTDTLMMNLQRSRSYVGLNCSLLKEIYFYGNPQQDTALTTLYSVDIYDEKITAPKVINADRQTILHTYGNSDVDYSKLRFDYSFFQFASDWRYEENIKTFGDIIQVQRKNFFYKGLRKAKIDSARYEDTQSALTYPLIPVKTWWNNYGFDKPKVVISALELFIGIFVLNLLMFKKLLEIYPMEEVISQRRSVRRRLRFDLRNVFLCMLYSGYLFFGIRFDVKNLKLDHLGLASWIIIQYILGLISLAYVANLIIGK